MMPRLAAATGTAAALLLALAGCHSPSKSKDVDALDRELIGNAANGDQTDPALTNALADQIMVDPALTQQKASAANRPGTVPAQAPIPATPAPAPKLAIDPSALHAPKPTPTHVRPGMTLGELAQMQAAHKPATPPAPSAPPARGDCNRDVRYSLAWAQRLPAALPLFPDAQVSEAAGNVSPGCNLRVVSFTSAAPLDQVIDFYYTRAVHAGYAAEHQVSGSEHILAGDHGDAAFYATFRARRGGGTEVDLVANQGR